MKTNQRKTSNMLFFKSWSRKRFAIFNSIGKHVKICSIAVGYTLVSLSVKAQGDSDTLVLLNEYDIDEVIVSASHDEVEFTDLARIVNIIPSSKIETFPSGSLNNLLESLPSIDIRQRGPHNTQADLGIKGGTHNQNLILLNGSYTNNPQTGHHNLNLPFDATAITKIEVLEGAATRIWGPNAFSGVVNFITTPTSLSKNQIKLEFGQHELIKTSFSLHQKQQNIHHKFDAHFSSSDGYIENTDFENLSVLYSSILKLKNIKLTPTLGVYYKRFGAQGYYSSLYPTQQEYVKGINTSLKTVLGKNEAFTANTTVNLATDRFELFREGEGYYLKNDTGVYITNKGDMARYLPSNFPYPRHNHHFSRIFNQSLRYKINSELGNTYLGASLLHEFVRSNRLGEPSKDTIPAYFDSDGTYFLEIERNSINLFVDQSISIGNFSGAIGILTHLNNNATELNYNPGIDIAYKFNDKFNVFASYNKAIRYPTFTELYYFDGVSVGDVNLKPETSESFEIGSNFRIENIISNANIFYIVEKDAIDFLRSDTLSTGLFLASNIAEYEKLGFNFSLLIYTGTVPSIKSIQLGYMHNSIIRNTEEFAARYSIDQLKNKLNLTIVQELFKKLTLSYAYQIQDRTGAYEKFININESTSTDYKVVDLLDFKMNYKLNNAHVFLNVSNVFNQQYIDYGNIHQPGRWTSIGFKYNF
jgi:vitamin B12 transporter